MAELAAGGHGQDQALRHKGRHLGADGAVRLAPAAGSVGKGDAHDHALHPARVDGAPAVAELEAGAGGGGHAAPVVLPVRRLVAEGHVEGGQPGDGVVGGGHGSFSQVGCSRAACSLSPGPHRLWVQGNLATSVRVCSYQCTPGTEPGHSPGSMVSRNAPMDGSSVRRTIIQGPSC